MTPDDHDPADLLHRALRDLPDVPAPRSLEDRVFAALAARDARPWWQRSALEWPLPARFALVTSCLAAAAGLTLLLWQGATVAREVNYTWSAEARTGWTALRALVESVTAAGAALPAPLLYAALAVGALFAATLGGGIAAYRSLVRN